MALPPTYSHGMPAPGGEAAGLIAGPGTAIVVYGDPDLDRMRSVIRRGEAVSALIDGLVRPIGSFARGTLNRLSGSDRVLAVRFENGMPVSLRDVPVAGRSPFAARPAGAAELDRAVMDMADYRANGTKISHDFYLKLFELDTGAIRNFRHVRS